ncbi:MULTISPECIES: hypothetical protein [Thermomonosporaceae]|uniref:hypothetical protein n=1 Tax=Thermomonosporaceae TaxID=2012 RepID=UPI00255A8A98|nr:MULTISPECIES: hypothetical protein [Thermomonosporaceae]MDL4773846.1 hypothetical protein [Actinomadura xylanilytica]
MRAINQNQEGVNPFEKAKKKGRRKTPDFNRAAFANRNARQMPARRLQRGR